MQRDYCKLLTDILPISDWKSNLVHISLFNLKRVLCLKKKKHDSILDKLKARDYIATSLSTYDFSLTHNLIKDDLIEKNFQMEGSPYLACNGRNAFYFGKNKKISCMVISKCI